MRKLRCFLSGKLFPFALIALLSALGVAALAVWLPRALAPVAAAERLFSLAAALRVAALPVAGERKTARLLVILFLPWLGAAFCLFPLPQDPAPSPQKERSFPGGTMNAVAQLSGGGCRAESAEYFRTGRAMSARLLADLSAANRQILIEYYILARGKFFGDILSVLERKAKAGVDVRIIYDDFGCALTLPRGFAKRMRARGIKAAAYHPLRLFPLSALNRRDHRKMTVIDGRTVYIGGINLADEYIGETVRFGHWKDTAARLTGEAAGKFAELFAKTWNACRSADKMRPVCAFRSRGIPCAVIADDGRGRTGEETIVRAAYAARERLFLNTPYLAPSERVKNALTGAARAGVDVRLMIPHLPDKKSVFLVSRRNARALERAGIAVREYEPGFLHAKSLTADGKYAMIGSYNLDARSLGMQAECGVFLEDEAFAAATELDFCACWETGVPVPPAKAGERVAAFLLHLLSPLM